MALDIVYSVTGLLYTFVIALIITTVILKWYQERNYPPGPTGIPVAGYMLFLGSKPHEKLAELSRKYGDVFSLYIGPQLNICVSDYNLAKDLLSNPNLLDRPVHYSSFITGGGGIVGMNGERWQEQRRFTFYTMRNLGMGKGLWETMIREAMAEFIEELKTLNGQPISVSDVLGTFHTSNIISLLLGRHLDREKDAEVLHTLDVSTKEFLKYLGRVSMFALFPWFRKFLEIFKLAGYDKFLKHLRTFETIFIKDVEERMKASQTLEKYDYIGCFFKEMDKRETEKENCTFTMDTLLGNLIVLFLSSHDPTLASISWLLLYMAAYPDVQRKVHDEIDSAVDRDGVIYFDDKAKFPYTMATIFEMLRISSIASLIPPRIIPEDMTINDYHIPKGSYLLVNLWCIMHDPKHFKDPMEFQPERFFFQDDKVIKSLDGFLPFSVGKRNCPGEDIAIMTVFLYFVSFMQKFRVTVPPGKEVDLESVIGGANVPKHQEICFLWR